MLPHQPLPRYHDHSRLRRGVTTPQCDLTGAPPQGKSDAAGAATHLAAPTPSRPNFRLTCRKEQKATSTAKFPIRHSVSIKNINKEAADSAGQERDRTSANCVFESGNLMIQIERKAPLGLDLLILGRRVLKLINVSVASHTYLSPSMGNSNCYSTVSAPNSAPHGLTGRKNCA